MAAGNVTGDGRADLITASGPGALVDVRIFDLHDATPTAANYQILSPNIAAVTGFVREQTRKLKEMQAEALKALAGLPSHGGAGQGAT